MGAQTPSTGPRRARQYPPLAIIAATVSALAMILPSALRVPQQDPTPVLEFAPVPPQDDAPQTNDGNVSSLALGSSDTLSETQFVTPPPPPGQGERPPGGKRCVRDPESGRRLQTEDPMSPPCVAYWNSDNGGETWQGVSEDEIRVLIYLDVGCPNHECSPDARTYHDLMAPAKPNCPKTWPSNNPNRNQCDYIWIRVARGLMHHFNERFQTYGRTVHYWAYISSAQSEKERRADAVDNWQTLKPFAVIDYATYQGHNEAYAQSMASRSALVFSSRSALPNSFFRTYQSYTYGFWPDVERWADQYSNYVCTKVHGRRVSRMGNPPGSERAGDQRVYGIWHTTNEGEPGLKRFAQLVEAQLKDRCGLTGEKATFRHSGFAVDAKDSGQDARDAIAKFRSAGVTTVLYLGGTEGLFSKQAALNDYYPEIVLAGDLENDNNYAGRAQEQDVWRNAWGIHLQLRMDGANESVGAQAYREGSPNGADEDSRFANEMYRDHFMLFQAIQVSGPTLNPEQIDKGFHVIPPKQSESPYVASCFFERNDYTCVKDTAEIWWDPTGDSPGDGQKGCWRMVSGGLRFRATDWEQSTGDVFDRRDAPCTGFDSRFQIDPNRS